MIAFVREAGHYARDTDFQTFLTACRAAPDDATPRLVLADWLDEWAGGDRATADHHREQARGHAAFLRDQSAPGYSGAVKVVKSLFGSDAPAPMKVWFEDLTRCEPWLGGRNRAAVNSTGSGVYYRGGLPEAVKCLSQDLYKTAELVALWRIPHVYVRYAGGALGVAVNRSETGEFIGITQEHCWMQAPVPFGTDRWVDTTDLSADRCQTSFVIETVLERAYGKDCPGAAFHAVHKNRWRSTHPC